MPNRILKESICTSPNVDMLSPEAEAFFYRLIVQCDDHGRMDARAAILRARCYPLRLDTVSNAVIEQLLGELISADLVRLYAAGGLPYLEMTTWKKHQQMRAQQSKYPEPPPIGSQNGNLQASDINCKQLRSIDINCNQLIANVPVIESNPIQSESESESNKRSAPDGAQYPTLPDVEQIDQDETDNSEPASVSLTSPAVNGTRSPRVIVSPTAHQAIFGALAEVCVLDPKLKAAQLGKTAKQLVAAGYDAAQVAAFGEWFRCVDWRGQRGSPPTLAQVAELIKQSTTPRVQVPVPQERTNGNGRHYDQRERSSGLPKPPVTAADQAYIDSLPAEWRQ